jgi:hypothetical protein
MCYLLTNSCHPKVTCVLLLEPSRAPLNGIDSVLGAQQAGAVAHRGPWVLVPSYHPGHGTTTMILSNEPGASLPLCLHLLCLLPVTFSTFALA